jgi:hypothetical protein
MTGYTDRVLACALDLEFDNGTHGLNGGWGSGSRMRARRP